MSKNNDIEMAEGILRSLIVGMGPTKFVAALNNVSAHGVVFEDADLELDDNDELLQAWFVGIEELKAAAKKIDKFNK